MMINQTMRSAWFVTSITTYLHKSY